MLNQLDLSEVSDRLEVMRLQEEKFYSCSDYISAFKKSKMVEGCDYLRVIDEECRTMMCDWCYQVVNLCRFQKEIVAIAFSYLDRYLCTEQGISAIYDVGEYQLATMTTLYIAVKIHEPVAMEPSLLSQLSRDAFCEQEFEEMEVQILNALGWKINGPTPLAFVQCFIELMPNSVDASIQIEIMDLAQQYVELAVYDYNLSVNNRPSIIALAAIANVMKGADENMVSFDTQRDFMTAIEKFSGLRINETLKTQSCLPLSMDTEEDTTATSNTCEIVSQKMPGKAHLNSPTSVAKRDSCMIFE